MRAGFLCPKCKNFACLHTNQDQNELHLKRWYFLPKSVSSVSRSQAYLVKRKRIGWSIGFNSWTFVWRHTKVFMHNFSQWCFRISIVENNGSHLMLIVLQTHFLSQQQYCRLYALFLAFHALVYRWGCQFLSLFSQDNEHMELTMLLFFQNPYATFAHILQHYHDFQSNVAIFPSVVQA